MSIETSGVVLLGVFLVFAGALPAGAQDDGGGLWPLDQDDAGSGQDAPGEPVPEVWIEPGVVYEGTLGVGHSPVINDTDDYYAFWGEQGDVVDAKARGLVGCFVVTDAEGKRVDDGSSDCTLAGWDAVYPSGLSDPMTGGPFVPVTLDHTGIHYLNFYYIVPQQYSFSIGIGGEAPEPGLAGQPVPPLPPLPR